MLREVSLFSRPRFLSYGNRPQEENMSDLDKAVDKLTVDAVEQFADAMLADARAGRSTTFEPKTTQAFVNVLRKLIEMAKAKADDMLRMRSRRDHDPREHRRRAGRAVELARLAPTIFDSAANLPLDRGGRLTRGWRWLRSTG
jgi:hypothetical protein